MAAVVEVIAGPHRLVSLMTAEAVEELGLKVGDEAVCVVKATNVIVEIPSVQGVASMKARLTVARRHPRCSSSPPVRAPAHRRRRAPRAPRLRRTATSAAASAAPAALTIYGAASLKGVLDKVKAAYESANPGTTLTISTDSSSALETQIEQGAPADVFLVGRHDEPEEARRQGPR